MRLLVVVDFFVVVVVASGFVAAITVEELPPLIKEVATVGEDS
jgi:hypothetical protein